jgi:ABC-2 type transport system ATP-binding protein
VLEHGKKLFAGKVSEVLNQASSLEVGSDNMPGLKIALNSCEMVESFKEDEEHFLVKVKEGTTAKQLNQWLFEKGITVDHLAVRKQSLEKYFLELLDKS